MPHSPDASGTPDVIDPRNALVKQLSGIICALEESVDRVVSPFDKLSGESALAKRDFHEGFNAAIIDGTRVAVHVYHNVSIDASGPAPVPTSRVSAGMPVKDGEIKLTAQTWKDGKERKGLLYLITHYFDYVDGRPTKFREIYRNDGKKIPARDELTEEMLRDAIQKFSQFADAPKLRAAGDPRNKETRSAAEILVAKKALIQEIADSIGSLKLEERDVGFRRDGGSAKQQMVIDGKLVVLRFRTPIDNIDDTTTVTFCGNGGEIEIAVKSTGKDENKVSRIDKITVVGQHTQLATYNAKDGSTEIDNLLTTEALEGALKIISKIPEAKSVSQDRWYRLEREGLQAAVAAMIKKTLG